MKDLSLDELFDRARSLTTRPENARERLQDSVHALHDLIYPYVKSSEEEKNLLIGHFGVRGETGSTLLQTMGNIANDLQGRADDNVTLLRICLLSKMTTYPSQYSRPSGSRENVIEALNRIIDSIGHWVEKNAEAIPPADRNEILGNRNKLATAMNEVYDFMEDTRPYFETRAIQHPYLKRLG